MRRAPEVLAEMAALPFADLAAITGPGAILVLAPHADDESLGCGGLIAQACAAGHSVFVAVLTDGTKSHPNSVSYPAPRLRALREAETARAVEALGLPPGRLMFLGYPDTAAPRRGRALREAGERLAGIMRAQGIGAIFASWRHDPHADHVSAHRIAALAARATGARHLSYAVWGWTLLDGIWLERTPVRGFRLDITTSLPVKRAAIACHRSQMTDLIADDPAAFRLPDGLLLLCDRPFEAFVLNGA